MTAQEAPSNLNGQGQRDWLHDLESQGMHLDASSPKCNLNKSGDLSRSGYHWGILMYSWRLVSTCHGMGDPFDGESDHNQHYE